MATSKNYGKKKVRITSGIFWTLMGKKTIMEKSDAGAACLSWTLFFFLHNSVGYHIYIYVYCIYIYIYVCSSYVYIYICLLYIWLYLILSDYIWLYLIISEGAPSLLEHHLKDFWVDFCHDVEPLKGFAVDFPSTPSLGLAASCKDEQLRVCLKMAFWMEEYAKPVDFGAPYFEHNPPNAYHPKDAIMGIAPEDFNYENYLTLGP